MFQCCLHRTSLLPSACSLAVTWCVHQTLDVNDFGYNMFNHILPKTVCLIWDISVNTTALYRFNWKLKKWMNTLNLVYRKKRHLIIIKQLWLCQVFLCKDLTSSSHWRISCLQSVPDVIFMIVLMRSSFGGKNVDKWPPVASIVCADKRWNQCLCNILIPSTILRLINFIEDHLCIPRVRW